MVDIKRIYNKHSGVLLSHKEQQHYVFFKKIDGTEDNDV
jgi:hypothetical protein